MRRSARLGLVGLTLPCFGAALASGCAALVGLDQTYQVDGGAETGDAGVDGGSDAGPLIDAAPPPDGSLPTDAGDTGDAAPTVFWVTDGTYGTNGFLTLAAGSASVPLYATPPTLGLAADGTAIAAYGDLGHPLYFCKTTTAASACMQVGEGSPVDLLSNAATGQIALVFNRADGALSAVSPAGSFNYGAAGNCGGVRGLSMSDAGALGVFAMCGMGGSNVTTLAPSTAPAMGAQYAPPPYINLISASPGEGSDVWLVGAWDVVGGTYARTANGAFSESSGTVFVSTTTLITDVIPRPDGALLVGYYAGTAAGFFATSVRGDEDGGPLPAPYLYPLTTSTVVDEATSNPSHTRVAQATPGVHVVVGASTTPPGLALVTVDDDGAPVAGSSTTPQIIPIDAGGGSVYVGGAVGSADGSAIYVVYKSGVSDVDLVVGIARLVRGTPAR
jgi:hypothetical protein